MDRKVASEWQELPFLCIVHAGLLSVLKGNGACLVAVPRLLGFFFLVGGQSRPASCLNAEVCNG
jgi:hypothetical protein